MFTFYLTYITCYILHLILFFWILFLNVCLQTRNFQIIAILNEHNTFGSLWGFFKYLWVDYVNTAFLWYVHITYFCHVQQRFLRFLLGSFFYAGKVFFFFPKPTFVLDNFESYRSLLKSPEFVAPRVSKEAYSIPVLTPPTLYKILRLSIKDFFNKCDQIRI